MDFWNRKKVKDLEIKLNIAESENKGLQNKLDIVESKARDLQKQIEKLEAKLRGERVCDGYCENCKHGIQYYNIGIYPIPSYKCELDCKCKDFERKEYALFDCYAAQTAKT